VVLVAGVDQRKHQRLQVHRQRLFPQHHQDVFTTVEMAFVAVQMVKIKATVPLTAELQPQSAGTAKAQRA